MTRILGGGLSLPQRVPYINYNSWGEGVRIKMELGHTQYNKWGSKVYFKHDLYTGVSGQQEQDVECSDEEEGEPSQHSKECHV